MSHEEESLDGQRGRQPHGGVGADVDAGVVEVERVQLPNTQRHQHHQHNREIKECGWGVGGGGGSTRGRIWVEMNMTQLSKHSGKLADSVPVILRQEEFCDWMTCVSP